MEEHRKVLGCCVKLEERTELLFFSGLSTKQPSLEASSLQDIIPKRPGAGRLNEKACGVWVRQPGRPSQICDVHSQDAESWGRGRSRQTSRHRPQPSASAVTEGGRAPPLTPLPNWAEAGSGAPCFCLHQNQHVCGVRSVRGAAQWAGHGVC